MECVCGLLDLLDSVRVEMDGKKRPLSEFATVSVKDGKDLVVSVYEESVSTHSATTTRISTEHHSSHSQ